MNTNQKIYPCPFCGSENVQLDVPAGNTLFVNCLCCAAFGPNGFGEEQAIAFWNKAPRKFEAPIPVSPGTIAFRRVNSNLPAFAPRKREEDADYDLFYAGVGIFLSPGDMAKLNTNIAIEFPAGYEGKVEEKGSLASLGLHILGGVIDHGYTGEIIVIVQNNGQRSFAIVHGEKFAQLKIREVSPNFTFEEVTRELRKTERGTGGFGSTGAK